MTFILYTFMTEYLLGPNGEKMTMSEADAKSFYHLFKAANYAFPIIGALISDIWLGKFKTIIWFSILYCIGLVVMVADQTKNGLFAGLLLIAIASGIIKPCVTANVGDQFGKQNKHLMTKIYNWFYFAINLGAFVGPFLTPLLLYNEDFGPKWAFGMTAVMMIFATVVFWLGRKEYVHAPAVGMKFVKECFSREGIMSILKLGGMYIFIAMFWGLFEQTGSSWIEQAKKMNLHFIIDWKAEQIPSSQALFVMAMIPIFSYVVYPAMGKLCKLTPLRKIIIGMFVTASSFIIVVCIAYQLNGGFVEKITSTTNLAGYSAVNLVDEDAGSYWISGSEPNQTNPQEIFIQLREKKKWQISEIDTRSFEDQFSRRELLDIVKREKRLEPQTVKKIKAAGDVKNMLSIAEDAFAKVGASAISLDPKAYEANDISVYIADFTGSAVPKIYSELNKEKQSLEWAIKKAQTKKHKAEKIEKIQNEIDRLTKQIDNYHAYLVQNGFKHIGDVRVRQESAEVSMVFDSQAATHILIVIKSNYGADRVRLTEIRALTNTPMPPDFDIKDAEIWPNVAAVGFQPNVGWHFIGNIILTAAELLVSVTSLEFMYSQAPAQMKSFIMSIYLLAISLGNLYASLFNQFVKGTKWETGPNYFLMWIYLMVGATIVVMISSLFYREKVHTLDEQTESAEQKSS